MQGKEETVHGVDRYGLRLARVDLFWFAAFFVVWVACAKVFWYSPLNGTLEAGLGRTGTDLLLWAIKAVVWLGFALAYLKSTRRGDPISYLKLRPHAAKGLAVGAFIGSALLTKDLAWAWLFEGRIPDFDWLTAMGLVISPFVEEVVFRGCVLQQAARYTGFWRANALSSALFLALHLPGWWFEGFSSASGLLYELASIFGLGLLFGYLLKRTRSLWSCVTAHYMNNLWLAF